jgi:hypothetical protein
MALGATGLVLVLVALMDGAGSMVRNAFIILVIAAVGGFYLASIHFRKKVAPAAVVIIHALVAVTGFLLLAATIFGVV